MILMVRVTFFCEHVGFARKGLFHMMQLFSYKHTYHPFKVGIFIFMICFGFIVLQKVQKGYYKEFSFSLVCRFKIAKENY